jgi:hypothetical protein
MHRASQQCYLIVHIGELTRYTHAGNVASHIAMPTTPVASSEVVLDDRPKPAKIWGA